MTNWSGDEACEGEAAGGPQSSSSASSSPARLASASASGTAAAAVGGQSSIESQVDALTTEQLFHAQQGLGKQGSPDCWALLAEEGPIRLYNRELVVDGLVCDPLKSVTVVTGVTAYEVCQTFFNPATRFEWELTLESMRMLEQINENTTIFHQVHKRIWPSSQRDAVFWSHIRKVAEPRASCLSSDDTCPQNSTNLKLLDVWIVCNNSTDMIDVPLGNCVRVKLTVSMVCETYVDKSIVDMTSVKRDDLICKIIYSASINPGGWVPVAALRNIYKREFVKFLSTFSKYVVNAHAKKPVKLDATGA